MNAFIQFLLISLAYPLVVVCIGNYIAGVLAGRKLSGFKLSLALEGFIEMIELGIIYVLVAWFVFSIRDITFKEISVFTEVFKVLVILIVAYKGNSLLLNLVPFSKVPMPVFMSNFDNYIKLLFKSPTPISGMNMSITVDSKDLIEKLSTLGKE